MYKENDGYYDLLRKLIEVDPIRGITVGQSLETQMKDISIEGKFRQFLPVRWVVDGEAVHVDLR